MKRLIAIAFALAVLIPAGPAMANAGGSPAIPLNGEQETAPADPDGHGFFTYSIEGDTLCYALTVRDIATAGASHIHVGDRGVPGPIVVGLQAPATGSSAGCITAVPDTTPNTTAVLTRSELAGIVSDPGHYYANVHNAEFPAGAIRGQLKRD
jgi:hypothetical protein